MKLEADLMGRGLVVQALESVYRFTLGSLAGGN